MRKKIKKILKNMQEKFLFSVADFSYRNRAIRKVAQGQPIRVLFVCHEPVLWSMFESIFVAMVKDELFSVSVVGLPYAHPTLPLGTYKDAGIVEYLEKRGIPVVRGYDTERRVWLNPSSFMPDYVFFQTPYNFFPAAWSVKRVSMIARVCYFSYGPAVSTGSLGDIVQPELFFKYTRLFLLECEFKKKLFVEKWNNRSWFSKERVVVTGYAKFDHYKKPIINLDSLPWKQGVRQDIKRILWSTRWNTNEGMCHFFEYKEFFVNFCREHDKVDFVFRPHPLFWQNFEKTGEFTLSQQEQMRVQCERSPNMVIDSSIAYEDTFKTCDILVSDFSSMLVEFFPSGNPIIYTHRKNMFNDYALKMAEGFYWVNNEEELRETLLMLLSGKDPLREKRKELIDLLFFLPDLGAGSLIAQTIKNDFNNR